MKKSQIILFGVIAICSLFSVLLSWHSQKKLRLLTKESSALYREFFPDRIDRDAEANSIANWDASLCKSLRAVPYAEDIGLVTAVKKIHLDGVKAPYNASVIENPQGEGYLMAFRYDIKQRRHIAGFSTPIRQKISFHGQKMPFNTYIGLVRLDAHFCQISPVHTVDTKSAFSEDPRIFTANGKLYLSYNDMQPNEISCRSMRLAELDPDTLDPSFILDIDQQINRVEKNWVPFTRQDLSGEEKIHFLYGLNPRKVLRMQDPTNPQMEHPVFPHHTSLQKLPWKEKKWGILRGGTPARRVGSQYLAFFHTLFYENKRPWYAMGAYTFELDPPHRITAVSATPILFRGIYDTPAINTAHSKKKAIYPSGMSFGKENGKDVIYLSCGENDSAIKILTFDQEKLLESLIPVTPYHASSP